MLLSQVHAMRDQMRPSERKLADYIIEAPREVLDLSMSEAAQRAGVSQPTIARFCRALGFSGFREFKIRLAQAVASQLPAVYHDVQADEPVSGLAAKVLDRNIAALMHVRNTLSADTLEAAIDLLAGASRIEFYGAGGSGISAQDIQHKFFRLGMSCVAYSDPHIFLMSAALLGPDDVVVAVSTSGRTVDIVDAARAALAGGAKVIAITRSNSPLARLATLCLHANIEETTDVLSPMASRVSHLAIGDILAVGVALQRGPQFIEKLSHSKTLLKNRRIPEQS